MIVRANEPNKTLREFSEKTGKMVDNAGQEAKGAAKQVCQLLSSPAQQ